MSTISLPARLARIVEAGWFSRTVLCTILLAGALAGLETSQAAVARFGGLFSALDAAVLMVFVAEMILKIASRWPRPWAYFQQGWNVFDFVIVVVCLLPVTTSFGAVFRLARALRLLRLITSVPKLQLLVGALLKSLGAMGYVTLLLALLFYIYGVAGVHLFGAMDPRHFGSLPLALLSLFRLITLDNWSEIFFSAQEVSPWGASVYFVSFILLGTMIMLNLFIGIIMNSMSEMHAEIEQRDREKHLALSGITTLADDFNLLERQVEELQRQITRLRLQACKKPKHQGESPQEDHPAIPNAAALTP